MNIWLKTNDGDCVICGIGRLLKGGRLVEMEISLTSAVKVLGNLVGSVADNGALICSWDRSGCVCLGFLLVAFVNDVICFCFPVVQRVCLRNLENLDFCVGLEIAGCCGM